MAFKVDAIFVFQVFGKPNLSESATEQLGKNSDSFMKKRTVKKNILFSALLFQSYVLFFNYIMPGKTSVQNIWVQG